MLILQLLVCYMTIYLSAAYTPFRLESCSTSSNPLLSLGGSLRDYPIEIPGEVEPYGTITLHRPITGHLKVYVTLKKWVLFGYIPVPCGVHIGICSYGICDFLEQFEGDSCPPKLKNNGINCTCPLNNGTYIFAPYSYEISEPGFPWSWLVNGDYLVNIRLEDTTNNQEVACYTAEFTVVPRGTRD